jgi:hypothetical protein
MDLIAGRYYNLKTGIKYIGGNNEKINSIVSCDTCSEKPKKYFEKISGSSVFLFSCHRFLDNSDAIICF